MKYINEITTAPARSLQDMSQKIYPTQLGRRRAGINLPTPKVMPAALAVYTTSASHQEKPSPTPSDPKSFAALEPGPFPIEAFPPVIRDMAVDLAFVHQIGVELSAMAALATLAAAIGKSVSVTGAVDGWVTPVNLYIIPAAPKSYGKGAAGRVVTPLLEASKRLLTRFQEQESAKLQAEMELLAKQKKQLLKDSTGDDESSDTVIEQLSIINIRIMEIKALLSSPPSYHVGEATGAALEEGIARNGHQILSFCLEAGNMVRSALGKMGRQATDLFLSGYSGENTASARISRGFKNLEPCITVLWFVQPCLLRELYSEKEVLERGLSARILAFSVEHDEVPVDDGRERKMDESLFEAWRRCVNQALEARESPRKIPVSSGAREVFRSFHNDSVQLRNREFRDISSELGRWRENAIRIAGVLAVAEGASQISQVIAANAVRICRWCVLNNLELLEAGRTERLEKRIERLRELLLKGEMTLRDLTKSHGFPKQEVRHLADVRPDQFEIITYKPPKGGRPSERMRLVSKLQKS